MITLDKLVWQLLHNVDSNRDVGIDILINPLNMVERVESSGTPLLLGIVSSSTHQLE